MRAPEPEVRVATLDDAVGIATVHVGAWQAAYRDVMADDYLDTLSIERRAGFWHRTLRVPPDPTHAVLVVDRGGEVLAFIAVGQEVGGGETPGRSDVGEVIALNVGPRAWGSGAGGALLAAGEDHLRAAGYDTAVLWVVEANARARRFYGERGWEPDGVGRTQTVGGSEVHELRYAKPLTTSTPDDRA